MANGQVGSIELQAKMDHNKRAKNGLGQLVYRSGQVEFTHIFTLKKIKKKNK